MRTKLYRVAKEPEDLSLHIDEEVDFYYQNHISIKDENDDLPSQDFATAEKAEKYRQTLKEKDQYKIFECELSMVVREVKS